MLVEATGAISPASLKVIGYHGRGQPLPRSGNADVVRATAIKKRSFRPAVSKKGENEAAAA